MNQDNLQLLSSRVALAAYLHDLGKFAERAQLPMDEETLAVHLQEYCPRKEQGGRTWYTHRHAAYTALGFDLLEQHLPELIGPEMAPFASWRSKEADDSLLNAAARHHKPETFLQWVIATADRVASGFDREKFEQYNAAEEGTSTGKNHFQARQLTLFEQIRLDGKTAGQASELQFRYPLKPLSVSSLFPQSRAACEPADNTLAQAEYLGLWEGFSTALEEIPASHRGQLPLWLDHFDSLWQCYAQAIPSATAFGVRPDVSLYDHSRTTAALAAALWRYHHDLGHEEAEVAVQMRLGSDWDEQKLLLVQGDFFNIQEFIFATGGDSAKKAAKLLRGRSAYVSLLTECAALRVLDDLGLPPTSQVINAAGKFLILAPNTEPVRMQLMETQRRINDWFLQQSYGQAGLGLAWEAASCNDFVARSDGAAPFQQLMARLMASLERAKFQAFSLCGSGAPAPVFTEYLEQFDPAVGACRLSGRAPGRADLDGVCALAADQVRLGEMLVSDRFQRLLLTNKPLQGRGGLSVAIFGYSLYFTAAEESSGKFGAEASSGNLRRAWDFSLPPEDPAEPLWQGYGRRAFNGYVPRFDSSAHYADGKYQGCDSDDIESGAVKTFNHIACEDRTPNPAQEGQWAGIAALGILKGDVDNLGSIFAAGLPGNSFARMSALSRQLDQFFTVFLPWHCARHFPDTYTVFAGGDDFFLIGPWRSQIRLAQSMRAEFKRYVAENPQLHFSAGIALHKPGLPLAQLSAAGEEALERAKGYRHHEQHKDAVCCFDSVLGWPKFEALVGEEGCEQQLLTLRNEVNLSTSYVYGLLSLSEQAEAAAAGDPSASIWRSRFAYRTQRMVVERHRGRADSEAVKKLYERLADEVGDAIAQYRRAYRLALQSYLYRLR
ncbi:type III-A CRISPR-associated protein Cas10/Csm1 [Microbulbifer flavimaris]|uniref:CRISPR system single-strand-specific deoxyribonuclease Cas10/Csm1 (subtype III-A) n=1 Tax=Microbulbifer flavimaris TaxID=1781068 RepID=A0ABX4HZP6_9GAMM|nr:MULTISPECIES: type III-A CRISPR-associated protein Cas10/Csm1 [Microbulbifer]KUJ83446.1 type III-A CRISPR-associated protein Cas10/Csm1 [Microbulbifer sp. ZGT114]PCO05602.1 type III-A CRISPR-associated protein Cas10/Csm1 [Microbulbifer flavimaris]